ncbi:MAG: hypothetical protein V4627_18185 [Pseudomonadota bacterium]
MNRIVILKSLAAAALALGTLVAATTAHARNDVQFSITLGTPGVYVQPAPVYARPRPVYVQPAPVYVQPLPVYAQPISSYVYPRPVYYTPPTPVHGGWGHQRHHHGRDINKRGPKGDYDHDGIPNRYDRFPGNPNWR